MALVVLQRGHYPRTAGATGTAGVDADPTEQEFAVAAAAACARRLAAAGHQVRVIDADVPDGYYRGDAFVAIHCDGSTSSSARGASVGYRGTAGHDFAQAWKRAYYNAGWRGFRPDNYTSALAGYYGTRHAVEQGNRVAFIAECGFLTSPDDEPLLSLPAGPERFARALTYAVVDIFGGTPPPEEDDVDADERKWLKAIYESVVAEGGAVERRTQEAVTLLRDDGDVGRRVKEVTLAVRDLVASDVTTDIDIDEDALAAALAAAIPPDLAGKVADELAQRLAG